MKYRPRESDLPVVPGKPELYVLKLEPGAPLPPEVPPDAQRYRLLRGENNEDVARIAALAAIAMAIGGVALSFASVPWWLPKTVFFGAFAPVAVALFVHSTADAPRYVPDDDGEYVRAPRGVVAERLGTLGGPPKLSTFTRALCGIMGALILGATLLLVGSEISDAIEYGSWFVVGGIDIVISLLFMLVMGSGFSWLALKGEVPFVRAVEIPASPWFLDLADPSVPLPDDAPISGMRPRFPPRSGTE